MNVSDFDYELPEELIAQDPIEDRSSSRLLMLDKKTGGSGDSYVSRNKGRTAEGKMVRYTTILVIAFMVISLILNIL